MYETKQRSAGTAGNAGTSRMRTPCGPQARQSKMVHLRRFAMAAMIMGVVAGSGLVCMHSSDSKEMATSKCALAFEDKTFCEGISSAVHATCQTFSTQICKAARKEHNTKCIDSWKLAKGTAVGDEHSPKLGEILDAGGKWVKGGAGQVCNDVCGEAGTCNSAKQSTLTSAELLRSAMNESGYTCKSIGGARSYSGTPFATGRTADDCFFMQAGATSSCTENQYGSSGHAPLCWCDARGPTPSPTPPPTPPLLPHVGFDEPSWTWNVSLWRSLGAQTPSVDCNPAKCANPSACGIPNCTLVSMEQLDVGQIANRADCSTTEGQVGTGSTDCLKSVPTTKFLRLNQSPHGVEAVSANFRKPWPTSLELNATEDEACRTAMGWHMEGVKIWNGIGADQVYIGSYSYTWSLHPASRLAFCQYNSYTTMYTSISPQLHPTQNPESFQVRRFIDGDPGVFNFTAGWSVSTRGYWAWPFAVFSLSDEDKTSTTNIGIFVFKRSVCKANKLTGSSNCYSMKNAQCYTSNVDFADTEYPSQVGTSQLEAFYASTKTLCTPALNAKVMKDISAFVASQ